MIRRPTFRWLDLRGAGLSMLERLSVEEALLRHTQDNWAIVGTHDVWPNKYLSSPTSWPEYMAQSTSSSSSWGPNPSCMIVMGIGGKPDALLNIHRVKEEGILVVKRFSGGGTVVLDHNSVWTTFIGRSSFKTAEDDRNDGTVRNNNSLDNVDPYPRSIMEWSADVVFGPTFHKMSSRVGRTASSSGQMGGQRTLVPDGKSCSGIDNSGKVRVVGGMQQKQHGIKTPSQLSPPPTFALRENDYILGGSQKIGGNAQSIIKGGWLHHTSFLWDYDPYNMESYLKLPEKRPEYRQSRSHAEFLAALAPYYGRSYGIFVDCLKEACQESFTLESANFQRDVLQDVVYDKLGGMDDWFEKNRTRILHDLK
jgi:lipoate-protein ligase A